MKKTSTKVSTLDRREFLHGLCGGALTLAFLDSVAGCGGGGKQITSLPSNSSNTPTSTQVQPLTKDITGVGLASTTISAAFVNDITPVGFGKAVQFSGKTMQGTKGSTVTLGVDAPGNVDTFYISVGGRSGYYKLDLTTSKQVSHGHASRDVSVHYNLEVNIPTGASDNLSVGIVSVISSVLSLLSGITICLGPCTPPPPPPDVTGNWTLTLQGAGLPALPGIPFRFASFKQQADATAIFNVIDDSGGNGGIVVGAGRIASNGNCTMYFKNPLNISSCNGFATSGLYIGNGPDAGGKPEIKGTVGGADLCASYAGGANPADFASSIDGAVSIWKKIS